MTRQTDITSDLDKSKTNENSTMLTCCFFNNNDPQNKKKLVFDCATDDLQVKEILNHLKASSLVNWEKSE